MGKKAFEDDIFVHPTAEVSEHATVGDGTKVWHYVQIRENAGIGRDCVLGRGVYIDSGVVVGNRVKIQNGAYLYRQLLIEDGVFIGPGVCFANDKIPRAITPSGEVKTTADWVIGETRVRKGASIGAGSVVLPGVTIGEFAMVGAGSVVTHDIPAHGLACGNPADMRGFVCACGGTLIGEKRDQARGVMHCRVCGRQVEISVWTDKG